jgi:hypothetical protein
MGLLPGVGRMLEQVRMTEADIVRSLNQMRAMFDSMTPAERESPGIIDAGRREERASRSVRWRSSCSISTRAAPSCGPSAAWASWASPN